LAKQIPGLRPWEVLEVEQVMDLVTYTKEWYREDLGEFTTRADYERDWFESFQVLFLITFTMPMFRLSSPGRLVLKAVSWSYEDLFCPVLLIYLPRHVMF